MRPRHVDANRLPLDQLRGIQRCSSLVQALVNHGVFSFKRLLMRLFRNCGLSQFHLHQPAPARSLCQHVVVSDTIHAPHVVLRRREAVTRSCCSGGGRVHCFRDASWLATRSLSASAKTSRPREFGQRRRSGYVHRERGSFSGPVLVFGLFLRACAVSLPRDAGP